jgi:phosphoglycolate phosphatase
VAAAGKPAAPLDGFAALVFDLDGTLIDSRRDLQTAVNRMRAELDLPPLGLDQVAEMVGEGARVLVRRALPAEVPKKRVEAALKSYLAHYAEVCLETTQPYPGIAAMLAELAPSHKLAVLSNKAEASSRRILSHLGLARFLAEIVGGDTLPTRKPNPGGLFLLADRLGHAVDRLVLVGDSRIDAETAAAAGCPFALVLWGFPLLPGEGEVAARWRFARPAEVAAAFGGSESDNA